MRLIEEMTPTAGITCESVTLESTGQGSIRARSRGSRIAGFVSFRLSLLSIMLVIGLVGCSDKSEESGELALPETAVLDVESSWAVITSSHLRLREQPDVEARIVTTLWRGYVLEVLAKQNESAVLEGETDFWYHVRYDGLQGWVFGAYLSLHTSRNAALAAGENLRQ